MYNSEKVRELSKYLRKIGNILSVWYTLINFLGGKGECRENNNNSSFI